MIFYFLLPAAAYLLGSVPFGLIAGRIFAGEDIRKHGSGNIGATNARRRAGNCAGILTLAGDIAKGAFPVYLAFRLSASGTGWEDVYVSFVAICAFAGHLYPFFMKGKGGGKGVATAGGCFLIISPFALLISVLVFILTVCMSSRVSAASLTGSAMLPPAVWIATASPVFCACAVIIAFWILVRHRENIRRLMAGTEPRI
ncbi:MAG: glycerol-3-phosphate 1-O-acyltransferase PlsY [Desulfococcaceae bacterium]|jgi:glycerol-3-phosphate acyltransferase PlsY|nr:glycerol-3-phosphate 1-O-acyltransferase PlsY [Desulfococcaceae bacterium]